MTLLKKPKREDLVCGCTYYNGSECSNCLNGAHNICKSGGCGITKTFAESERDYYKAVAEFTVGAIEKALISNANGIWHDLKMI